MSATRQRADEGPPSKRGKLDDADLAEKNININNTQPSPALAPQAPHTPHTPKSLNGDAEDAAHQISWSGRITVVEEVDPTEPDVPIHVREEHVIARAVRLATEVGTCSHRPGTKGSMALWNCVADRMKELRILEHRKIVDNKYKEATAISLKRAVERHIAAYRSVIADPNQKTESLRLRVKKVLLDPEEQSLFQAYIEAEDSILMSQSSEKFTKVMEKRISQAKDSPLTRGTTGGGSHPVSAPPPRAPNIVNAPSSSSMLSAQQALTDVLANLNEKEERDRARHEELLAALKSESNLDGFTTEQIVSIVNKLQLGELGSELALIIPNAYGEGNGITGADLNLNPAVLATSFGGSEPAWNRLIKACKAEQNNS